MANTVAGMIGKSILLLLLIVVLLIGGVFWFDFLGIIDRGEALDFFTKRVGIEEPVKIEDEDSNIYLLDAVRLVKEREAIERKEITLESREEGIILKEAENKQVLEELKEKEAAIVDKEKSLTEALTRYDDEQKNLETTVRYLADLPPQTVVSILDNYPVLKVVDTLRKEDEISATDSRISNSSTWILFMDAKRAAEVNDMMIKKPTPKN